MHDRRRRFLLLATAGTIAVLVGGCATTPSFSGDALMGSLTGAGLSTKQAAGGLGALASLAQSKLSPADFASFSKYLPSTDSYLSVAKQAGLLSSPIRDIQGLNSAFGKLGLDPNQARGLLGLTSDYLSRQGGESARSLLTRTLG